MAVKPHPLENVIMEARNFEERRLKFFLLSELVPSCKNS
jgi:hypothetical protein